MFEVREDYEGINQYVLRDDGREFEAKEKIGGGFAYEVSWEYSQDFDPDEVLSRVPNVVFYGDPIGDIKSENVILRDVMDTDKDIWGVDFWHDEVDLNVPKDDKLNQDFAIELLTETTDVSEDYATLVLNRLQKKVEG